MYYKVGKPSRDNYDEHCLVYRDEDFLNKTHGKLYLIVGETDYDYKWTEDRDEATVLADDEAKKWQEKMNEAGRKERPFPGYVRIENLPLVIEDREPKYQIGDIVYILSTEDPLRNSRCYGMYKGKITEITVDYFRNTFDEFPRGKDYFYKTDNFPFMYPISEQESIATGGQRMFGTKEEFEEDGCKFYTEYREEYMSGWGPYKFKVIR